MQNYRWSKYDAMHCRRMHHLNPIKQKCPKTDFCKRVFATLLGNIILFLFFIVLNMMPCTAYL